MTFKGRIPYGRHQISEGDVEAVLNVLHSDFLTQGPMVPRFEEAVANYCNIRYAVAVNSATSALHVACLALGVGPGDRVWTTPNTFVASANCGRYCGADVDFVDIDPTTYNLCPQQLAVKLEVAERSNLLPKVVIPVHFSGQPCDMADIHDLAQRYHFKIIEDASHAIGARYRGTLVGDCTYCDITVFSFHPVKIITTGEGGLATTRSDELARRMQLLRSHGVTREANECDKTDVGPWYYEQHLLGFNYRLTDLHAALGLSQLARLDEFVGLRNDLARRYDEALQDLPLLLPTCQSEALSSFHLYVIRLQLNVIRKTHRQVFDMLRRQGIDVNVHYIPVHLQPYYRKLGFKPGQYLQAEAHGESAITLPMYAALTEEDQSRVIAAVRETLCESR